jgi:TetR/AcrR family transcriptional regulator, transcriptional repressor for nem operon
MPRTSDARERIVATAARLFLERSYQAVGVDELCGAANVRKGSFYHYFASKSELAKAVIDRHADVFIRRLDDSVAARHDPAAARRDPAATRRDGAATRRDDADLAASPAQRLHAFPDAIGAIQSALEAQFGRSVGCPFGNFAAELSTTDDDLRAHVAERIAAMESQLAATCRDAAEQGLLRAGTDPDQLAHALMAQYQGIILLAKLNNAGVSGLAPALHAFIDGYLVEPA